jgi:hypothetical protein
MTETEWSVTTDMELMLGFLRGPANDRKLRLFACACCRRAWHLLTDERSRRAVEAAERYVEGRTTDSELQAAWSSAYHAPGTWQVVVTAATLAAKAARRPVEWVPTDVVARHEQAAVLRDILGPLPFRTPRADPAWLLWNDRTVVRIAEAVYQVDAFDRMPIFADALEDAGCDDTDILNHCREPGEHVRGCWVVDQILGKE